MATRESDSLRNPPFHGEQGNLSVWRGDYAKAGVLNGDVLRLAVIPAGAEVTDMDLVHDDAGTGVTAKLGYEPVNSSDGPAAVDDYWLAAGQDLAAAAGRIRSAAHAIRFDYDVYVILTVAGANFTGSPKVAVIAKGEYVGTK
jgi:hypothetical protein